MRAKNKTTRKLPNYIKRIIGLGRTVVIQARKTISDNGRVVPKSHNDVVVHDQAMTMARTRENLIFDQLATQFKKAVKEEY